MEGEKHLLIAFDNSPAGCNAVKYCGQLFGNDPNLIFELIYCYQTPASILPEPADRDDSLLPSDISRIRQIGQNNSILEKGIEALESSGIDRQYIQTTLVPASNQIAQTIIAEADNKLVDAIVVARRGLGYLGEMVLGSVSGTLLRQSRITPLWIIDGDVGSENILIGVDGSINAFRAVDHIAHMFKNRQDITIYLYHCAVFLAPEVVCTLDQFYLHWDRQWCDTHLSGDGCLFKGPVQLLKESGIDSDRIVILPQTRTLEESTSIIAQAKKHDCGTIVIGRRGPSVTKGFFGGVSNRTIRKTQDMAVWIVG